MQKRFVAERSVFTPQKHEETIAMEAAKSSVDVLEPDTVSDTEKQPEQETGKIARAMLCITKKDSLGNCSTCRHWYSAK